MSTYDSSIVFTFNKPLKQSNPRTQVKPLVLKAYTHDESLCVFSTLKEYLQRTETLRVTGCGCSTAKLCQRTVLGNRSLDWLSARFFGFLYRVMLVREIVLHRLA